MIAARRRLVKLARDLERGIEAAGGDTPQRWPRAAAGPDLVGTEFGGCSSNTRRKPGFRRRLSRRRFFTAAACRFGGGSPYVSIKQEVGRFARVREGTAAAEISRRGFLRATIGVGVTGSGRRHCWPRAARLGVRQRQPAHPRRRPPRHPNRPLRQLPPRRRPPPPPPRSPVPRKPQRVPRRATTWPSARAASRARSSTGCSAINPRAPTRRAC